MIRRHHPDYTVVRSALNGRPLLLVPGGYVYLSESLGRDQFNPVPDGCRTNPIYEYQLTDEEEIVAMRWILLGEDADA
jgi:hypothetical protein